MRAAFASTLLALAKANKNIILLTGDLGFSVFEEYIEQLPNQYLNAGVAEQNMTGIAAGMAMEGKIPVIYSIIPFITMRNFEQIRNDICYQNLNVKIVGVGAGFSYGPYGHTHHGLEDIGILRTLPNLTILCPGDPIEARLCVCAAFQADTPVYIRLGKGSESTIHAKEPSFAIGKGLVIHDGTDITILTTSTMLSTGQKVLELLAKKNISVRFISMPSIKPLDIELLKESATKTKSLFSIEEHSVIGGLGSAVSEVIAENSLSVIFRRFGVPDRFTKAIGSREYMRAINDLSPQKIASKILEAIRKI